MRVFALKSSIPSYILVDFTYTSTICLSVLQNKIWVKIQVLLKSIYFSSVVVDTTSLENKM